MGSHKTLMFVYIHPRRAGVGISTWRGGGLFISTKAFGDASIKINSTKSLRFSISLTLIIYCHTLGTRQTALFTYENVFYSMRGKYKCISFT